jgi:translation initiation factor IF-2
MKKQPQQNPYAKREKGKAPMQNAKKDDKAKKAQPIQISVPEEITVGELAKLMKVTAGEIVKKLMMMGVMATVNQVIDYDTAYLVAEDMGAIVTKEVVVTIEDKLFDEVEDTEENLETRSPVVCVMGHVDHGKTSLLDAIRHTHVTSGEAGGITQHIGAYRVNLDGQDITFLDTPGHEAFTAMRARGAKATDIAIIVVAADDGIMPQTIEAINHAKAAGVDIIVAINKIDKPTANPDAVMTELTKYDLVPEEWGGDVICVPVSAHTKKGLPDLLESVLMVAELKELKANPNRRAKGIVIEAKLDRGRGPVASVLVQNGTLHEGDTIICGTAVGRVRAMTNERGQNLKVAGPSVPVEITGLDSVPSSGDEFNVVEDERMARQLADQRKTKEKEDVFKANAKVNLDELFAQIKEGVKDLNIVVKADVKGSAEAVKSSLEKLTNEEVKVNVIHVGVGGITENDVMLASASNALIVGFNVRPDKTAMDSGAAQGVDIRTYRVIYECIEEVEAAIKGMLKPVYRENVLGHAEVRQTIHVPNVGTIAGSYITDGKVTRSAQIRVVRDGVVIFEDKISSLRRFKDDVREVASGYECGIGLEKFNDIKENDVLEAFIMEEIERT